MSKRTLYMCLFGLTLISVRLTAQENIAGRIPEYKIAYEFPSVDDIKEVLNQVRLYYESTSDLKIINPETGIEITDFSIPDRKARVSGGFAAEWSYTNGVVLSAFEYISAVTGDPLFFANNTRFFDRVTETLPYFIKNREKYGREAMGGWGRTPDFEALDDCGSIGAAMIKTYLKNNNDDYLDLINTIAEYISTKQFRLEDGTLARHRPQYQSVWADDLYMSVPFLANMGRLTGDN
ncbi:MAG: glycoside hydrolase family 88 protein, partial [Bacteroidales bacterium]|nr:glycoside hydrolase family 88 protein [Bacteroidales bacterium]